jgi:predicted enzyme related to lactoylglutathione lyase
VSDPAKPPVCSIGWCDLTVPNADDVRDFYRDVVGWTPTEVDMGGYSDFVMRRPDDATPTTGVCWARGGNAGLPPVWLVYFVVASLEVSLDRVRNGGGTVLRDPAAAVCALYENGS